MDGEKVPELVVYRLNDGVSREQFLDANDPVSARIREQPGFIARDLVFDTEGSRWVDVVWWESMHQAQAASRLAMTSESCTPMFALIDMESALMLHGAATAATVSPATAAGAWRER